MAEIKGLHVLLFQGISFVVVGLLHYFQALCVVVNNLAKLRYNKNRRFVNKLPNPPQKTVSFTTFSRTKDIAVTKENFDRIHPLLPTSDLHLSVAITDHDMEKSTSWFDFRSGASCSSSAMFIRSLFSVPPMVFTPNKVSDYLDNNFAFENSNSATTILSYPIYVTPMPFTSFSLFLILSIALMLLNNSQKEVLKEGETTLAELGLSFGFMIALGVEYLERSWAKYVPERATAVAISFALLNEVILLSSQFDFKSKVETRLFQFSLASLLVLLGLMLYCIVEGFENLGASDMQIKERKMVGTHVIISFVSCVHGGIFFLTHFNRAKGLQLAQDDTPLALANVESEIVAILEVHFQLSQLMFVLLLIFFGLYLIAYQFARFEISYINVKFSMILPKTPRSLNKLFQRQT